MKKLSYHTVLFAIFMVVLCLPMVQHFGHVFKFKELGGYTAPLEPVKLSWQTFRDQSWQDYEQKFLQQNFGTHWAYSTIPFVADTILQKIASVKGYAMPHTICVDSNVSIRYFGSDKELEEQLNLLFPLRHERIPTPKFTLQGESKSQKPNLLVVGDSYFSQLEKTDFVKAFHHVDYWKYNETAYFTRPNCSGSISHLNRYEILTGSDVVLVIFTDMHAFDYFFGFIRTIDRTLEDGPNYDPENAILNIIERIKATPEWYEKVKGQAKEKGISLEQCLRENAQWVFEQDHK